MTQAVLISLPSMPTRSVSTDSVPFLLCLLAVFFIICTAGRQHRSRQHQKQTEKGDKKISFSLSFLLRPYIRFNLLQDMVLYIKKKNNSRRKGNENCTTFLKKITRKFLSTLTLRERKRSRSRMTMSAGRSAIPPCSAAHPGKFLRPTPE